MKKIIFLGALLVSGCSWLVQNEPLDTALCQEETDGDIVAVDNEDFRLNEDGVGLGQFSLFGSVDEREEVVPLSGEVVKTVYLVVSDPSENSVAEQETSEVAYDYFVSQAEKNPGINSVIDGKLYFKLGVLEDDTLKSEAHFTEGTADTILSMRGSGDLTLTMLQAVTLGKGASEYTVMPCAIAAN